jgi:hypothetical protein
MMSNVSGQVQMSVNRNLLSAPDVSLSSGASIFPQRELMKCEFRSSKEIAWCSSESVSAREYQMSKASGCAAWGSVGRECETIQAVNGANSLRTRKIP